MKKHLFATASLMALATPVAAAPRAPAMPVAPVYNWTGWYAGGNVGYSWGTANSNYTDPGFACCGGGGLPTSFSGSEHLDGAIGGAQLGYNWQVGPTWVWGVETDFQGSGERGSRTFSNSYCFDCEGFPGAIHQTQQAKILWFGTVRGRAGVLINPTLLVYGTGGLAYGQISGSGTVTDTSGCAACSWSYSGSTINAGWTVGAGVEGAIPGLSAWTWKVEYLYIDFGSVGGSGYESDFGSTYTWSAKITDNIFRIGFNYGFH